MKNTKPYFTISIISAVAFALSAFAAVEASAASPGGGGPDSEFCDGTGPGIGNPQQLRDGSGGGEGAHGYGRGGERRGMPRFDGRGPRQENAPRLGLGRTGQGRGLLGECDDCVNERVRARDGSGAGTGQMNRNRNGGDSGPRAGDR